MKKQATLLNLLLMALACSVAGCGTSPPSKYYTLDTAGIDYTRDVADAPVLGIGPIRVPDYLDRPQIVTRSGGARLEIDEFRRWAEPVHDALHRILAENVDALLDGTIVVGFPYGMVEDYSYRVVGRVSRFDMDAAGVTRLSVLWTIASADDDILVAARRALYTETGGDPGDANSVAVAMSACLEQFSRDIARTFDAAHGKAGTEAALRSASE